MPRSELAVFPDDRDLGWILFFQIRRLDHLLPVEEIIVECVCKHIILGQVLFGECILFCHNKLLSETVTCIRKLVYAIREFYRVAKNYQNMVV